MALGRRDRQRAFARERIFCLPPCGIGGAVDAERAEIEDGQQVQLVQLGRKLKPRLSRMACQMRRRLRRLEVQPTLLTRADRDRPLLGTYPAVCFAFDGGDKVRGEKVHECSELGREMPARRP